MIITISQNSITSINATVENENNDIDKVIAVVFGQDFYRIVGESVYANNNFNLDLSPNLALILLYPLCDGFPEWVTLSSKTVLANNLNIAGFHSIHHIGYFSQIIEKISDTNTSSSYLYAEALYIYVNEKVVIKGYNTEEGTDVIDGLLYETEINRTYNLNLSQGWNVIFFKEEDCANFAEKKIVYSLSMTDIDPGGLKWHFENLEIENLSPKSLSKRNDLLFDRFNMFPNLSKNRMNFKSFLIHQ